MYIYIYMCKDIFMYMYIRNEYVYFYVCVYMFIDMNESCDWSHGFKVLCIFIATAMEESHHTHICRCMHIHIYMYKYTYTYIQIQYIHIYMYTYMYINMNKSFHMSHGSKVRAVCIHANEHSWKRL